MIMIYHTYQYTKLIEYIGGNQKDETKVPELGRMRSTKGSQGKQNMYTHASPVQAMHDYDIIIK